MPLPEFSYLLPFELEAEGAPAPGVRVVVPWQSGVRIGLVTTSEQVGATKGLELREIISVLDAHPFIPAPQVAFLGHLAEAACSPAGMVLAALAATGFNADLIHEVRAVMGAKDVPLPDDAWTDVASLKLTRLDTLRRQGLVRERVRPQPRMVTVLKPWRQPDDKLSGKPQTNQRLALVALWDLGLSASGAELARDVDVPESAVRALVKKGYAGYAEAPAPPPALPTYPPVELGEAESFLPGSSPALVSGGLRQQRLAALVPLLKQDLRAGKSVLVLVPEQVLLVETAGLLASRLPTQVMSGDLNDVQRARLWAELGEHEPVVLVGSYLALLAPLKRLGRVVVLEEGSSSYKLHSGPRLFVPAAARLLARTLDVPFLSADALPTPESLCKTSAETNFKVLTAKPRLHVSDLSRGRNWPLSSDLVQVLKQVAERERQAVVLAPRRGFSAALGCSACGWQAGCPNCDLPLRYHQRQRALQCHQCGYRAGLPDLCAHCGGATLGPLRGAGTQWVMNEIKVHLGDFPLYQYDADTRDDLGPLTEGAPGVVVGTTAILRHPLLANVSLVALTLFDTLLGFSDFRAEEESLRLLLQLAELTPQRRPLLLLQTFQPEHSLLRALRAEDIEQSLDQFLARLLERRQQYSYPPFVEVAKIQVSARQDATARSEAERLGKALALFIKEDGEVLGPNPAPVTRLRGLYNYQLFVRDLAGKGFSELLQPAISYAGRARVRVDVDPRDIGGFLD